MTGRQIHPLIQNAVRMYAMSMHADEEHHSSTRVSIGNTRCVTLVGLGK